MQLPSHSAQSPSTMAHRDPRSLASSYAYSSHCTRSSLPCAPSAHTLMRYSICRCSHSPPLPRCSDPVPADVNTSTSTTVLALTWTTTALYTLAMPLATTPLHGPDLHYDPPNIYAPATLALAAASSCTGKHSSRRPGIEMGRNQNRGQGREETYAASRSSPSFPASHYTPPRATACSGPSPSLPILPGDMRASAAYLKIRGVEVVSASTRFFAQRG
ncbi:hypothetical protein FIBSPDRAFT_466951 [Athelia psychrophila]|uniref:Uncharacterized protein n=1 Tax=Athelia psychrophila TaxID=1759441 RepID=A0A166LLH9_9AGAM|nr:hypothetical protein FIBSPDRAFT_466951 [Fibularhizoctonia sp. CBS 109695]